MQSPPEHKRHDVGHSSDSSKKRENKNLPPISKTNAGPSTSSGANDLNLSSVRNSSNHTSDDDAGTVQALGSRTLPGNLFWILYTFSGPCSTCIKADNSMIQAS